MSAISAVSPPTRSSSRPAACCDRRWRTRRGSIAMLTGRPSAWWRGSRPTMAWCWNNEHTPHLHPSGTPCRGRALFLDGAVLPGTVRLRAEDQPVADGDRTAALSAGVRSEARRRGGEERVGGAVAG